MKLHFVLLSCVFTVCILSACGTGNTARIDDDFATPDTAQPAESTAVSEPNGEDGAESIPPQTAGTLHALSSANAQGWYKICYDDTPGWYAREITFADATEKRLSVPAGMPDGIAESGRPGDLQVDDAQLVWSWSGLLTDTPALVVTDLDGHQTGAVSFPQGWYLTGWEPMAADDQYIYAKGGIISDDPERLDERRLLRLDPAHDTVETLTTWDEYGGQLLGVWDGKLLLTRRMLNPACPVQPVYRHYHIDNFNELKPFLREFLYALDPVTGRETILAEGPVYTFGSQRKLAGDALWWVDGTHLMRQPLGTDTAQSVAELPQGMWLQGAYDEDVFLAGLKGKNSARYVYHVADGLLTERNDYDEVVCQAGAGEYLVLAGDGTVRAIACRPPAAASLD